MAKNNSPKHFVTVDPQKEWQNEWTGFFHAWRGLITAGVGKAIGLIGLQWFVQNWWITGAMSIVAITCWLLLLWDRNRLIWCWCDKRTLHDFCHWLRDEANCRPQSSKDFADWTERFSDKACSLVAAHYRQVFCDETITSAIRVARLVEREELFVTVGRSDGMDPARKNKSKGIRRDQGIAKILMDKHSAGIWLIPDIPAAVDLGMWEKTNTDSLDDVKYVMAAPINGFEAGSKAMIGILYVCSAKRPFKPLDTVELRAWADLLGLAYFDAARTISAKNIGGE